MKKCQIADPLHKNKALTFASLYEVSNAHGPNEKKKILNTDISILQRLIIAFEARKTGNLHNILNMNYF